VKLSVEIVANGFIVRVGTSKPYVIAGHDTTKLAELLAELFGVKDKQEPG
jgi:hypothetical protein